MKYFIDTEFLEGPQKESFPISLFRKQTPNTIDLISIGIVAEDGREFYAISKDFNLKEAWNRFDLEMQSGDMRNVFPEGRKIYWLRENVLKPIFEEFYNSEIEHYNKAHRLGFYINYPQNSKFSYSNFKRLLKKYGKTNKEIATEIKAFTKKAVIQENENGKYNISIDESDEITKGDIVWDKPEFYAYYADYDWVVFCWLFGKMIDLPKGFLMYCNDLKQEIDRNSYKDGYGTFHGKDIKNHPNFPKQDSSKSHNAIEDARWNKQLFEFLAKL